jgi:predicted Zn-ribbon and HTH transcriptional regulator
MSIAIERFGSNEQSSDSLASSGLRIPVFPYRLQCHACGFEPFDAIAPPQHCPKCFRHSWERFAFPRSLLLQVDRCANDRTALRSSLASIDTV